MDFEVAYKETLEMAIFAVKSVEKATSFKFSVLFRRLRLNHPLASRKEQPIEAKPVCRVVSSHGKES